MSGPITCYVCQEDLQQSKVLDLLLNPKDECISPLPPVNPKADVYLFSPGENTHAKGRFVLSL